MAAPLRVGVFLFGWDGRDDLSRWIARIPIHLDPHIAEIVVMLERSAGIETGSPGQIVGARDLELRFHRPPRDSAPGEVRRAAFEYALSRPIDHVVVMSGRGAHPPELLEDVFERVARSPRHALLVTRIRLEGAAGAARHRLFTVFQNRTLGLRLGDYHTAFRVYPTAALRRIPFQLDSDGPGLDAEILIQLRCLGVPIDEWPGLDARPGDGTGHDSVGYGLAACATALSLRLHQMHVTRDGRYLVDHDVHYTLKQSRTGSHMQIVSAIRDGSEVLDLGCSQGLLARPLKQKRVRVTGVDRDVGDRLAEELAEYHQRDLEQPLDLPIGRVFDYVVCADVIEHVQNRSQLLRSARRHLKQDGRLIISTPNIALWFYRLSLLIGRFEYGPRGVLDETHVHLFTGSTFRRTVERAGFQVVARRVTALPFEVVFQSTGRSRLVRGLASVYHLLARLWPSMFAYQFVLEAKITTLDDESVEGGVRRRA
jgi:SAM-dependent methyltransferase